MKTSERQHQYQTGFTMVEMLIVIAVIGVMSALVISAFSGAAQDTRKVIARQQQAAVQNAVNAWVNSESARVDATTKKAVGLSGARAAYNAAEYAGSVNAMAKLILVGGDPVTDPDNPVPGYLDESTAEHLISNTTNNNQIQSHALKKIEQYLTLGPWTATSYPKVELNP